MGPDGMEIEVPRSEEEIRAERAQNVKGYFEAKRAGEDFNPDPVKTSKRLTGLKYFDDGVKCMKEELNDYGDEVKAVLEKVELFKNLFIGMI